MQSMSFASLDIISGIEEYSTWFIDTAADVKHIIWTGAPNVRLQYESLRWIMKYPLTDAEETERFLH